jgi:G6PDH family F420-dependent oxidoreductase
MPLDVPDAGAADSPAAPFSGHPPGYRLGMQIGYKLAAEAFAPQELIRQAVVAEAAGFDFVEISDHYHPWLDVQGHSPFARTMLGAIAVKTDRIGLATGVTCPTVRYHPAIIAQAAATLALVADGRFILGIGAGERLNEHVVGRGFPSTRKRHEMLREALEIIRLLWQGGYRSYDGKHLQLEDARVFDLPEQLPLIAVAASGKVSATIAAELGDGLFATEPKSEIVESYRAAGGTGPGYAEAPVAWAPDAGTAAQAVLEKSRWALTGWKVMSELPNPVNFDAASATVTEADVLRQFACGPDPERHVEVAKQFTDAGFDRIVLQNAGPDPDGFIEFFRTQLESRLRALEPAKPSAATSVKGAVKAAVS